MLSLDHRFDHAGQSVAWGRIGDGPPLVLIHGFPWSSQIWRRVAPWVAAKRTVYFFDMLGSGQSEKHDGQDVRPQVQNDLLAALIDHWGLTRPEIVGHDFGGLAALRGLFVNDLAYSKLTLFDAVSVLPSGSPLFAHIRDNEAALAGLPAYAHEALFRAYAQNAATRPMAPDVLDLHLAPYTGAKGQAAFYRQIAQSDIGAIEELMPLYRKPDFPVRLYWAAEDTFIPPHQGDDLAARLEVPAPVRLPGAGHVVQEDAPEQVVAALLADM